MSDGQFTHALTTKKLVALWFSAPDNRVLLPPSLTSQNIPWTLPGAMSWSESLSGAAASARAAVLNLRVTTLLGSHIRYPAY